MGLSEDHFDCTVIIACIHIFKLHTERKSIIHWIIVIFGFSINNSILQPVSSQIEIGYKICAKINIFWELRTLCEVAKKRYKFEFTIFAKKLKPA